VPPFAVLHVCMGNICRSPMAERLLAQAVRERVGDLADSLLLSSSAGTGGWHAGEEMNPPAAREVRRRGGLDAGFAARRLLAEHIDTADLVLTATAEQAEFAAGLRPDAADRTFVLGEFGRLLPEVDAYDTHRARTRVARGVNRAGSVVGVDEPLDFCLVLAAPGRRTILDRAGRQDCDKDEEQGDPGPAGQCGAGNGA